MLKPATTPLHEDPDLFREALNFTAAETAFAARLIEKDYFCTVLLEYFARSAPELVFKGGTCLAKVHVGFYRLSEDLDFTIPMPAGSTRGERRSKVASFKKATVALPNELPAFRLVGPLTGANSSTQYNAVVAYESLLIRQQDVIKVEVSLREPLLTAVFEGLAATILVDPLSRRDPAIRDFFDLDYAVRRLDLQPGEAKLTQLVREKLSVAGNESVDVSEKRLAALHAQIDPRLKPVLRANDFVEFELERAFELVRAMARNIEGR